MVYYRQFGLNNITTEEQNLLRKNFREIIQRYGFRKAADFAATFGPKTLGIIFGVEEVYSNNWNSHRGKYIVWFYIPLFLAGYKRIGRNCHSCLGQRRKTIN